MNVAAQGMTTRGAQLVAHGSGQSASAAVGLVAGWGRYPLVVAEALRRQNIRVCCLGVRNHADPALRELCDDFAWMGLARLGRAIRYFRGHGIEHATMAGKIHKVLLFQRGAWLRHLPDWQGLKTFYPHFVAGSRDRKDDTLLGAIVETFARKGIQMGPATDYAPELLAPAGQLTDRGPTAAQLRDIRFGWEMAKEMGRLDIGQSVVVKDQAAIAIEAIEGTDLCIRRAGELCPVGGFTVVKTAKPRQDMRFDVPTIGVGTIESIIAAGGAVLAIEAGRTILVDQTEMIALANRHRLCIVSVDPGEFER